MVPPVAWEGGRNPPSTPLPPPPLLSPVGGCGLGVWVGVAEAEVW